MTKNCIRAFALTLMVGCSVGSPASADLVWECPKTFTMSSKIGISESYNGTDYLKYVEGQFICDMIAPDTDECYFRYENVMEGDGAVVGFYRQRTDPRDTQTIVLDLKNQRFYKTFEQGDLKVTIFGDCQQTGQNQLNVKKTRKDDALALLGATVLGSVLN